MGVNIEPDTLFAICIASVPVILLGVVVIYHALRQWKGDDR